MRVIEFSPDFATALQEFEASGATALPLASGTGEIRSYVLYFEPGGRIGPHPAGFGQLLIPLKGSGWVAGPDGVEFPLTLGQAAYFPRGELHSKGSEDGMTALMLQTEDLAVEAWEP